MNRMNFILFLSLLCIISYTCDSINQEPNIIERTDLIKYKSQWTIKPKLSDYKMFQQPLRKMIPRSDLIPYTLASELFSDYAKKQRFIFLPQGKHMSHTHADRSFEFPDESIIFKYFYYPHDETKDSSDYTIIETRVLHKIKGNWQAYSYVWNEEQTDAYLQLAGDRKDVTWIAKDGKSQSVNYSVPNAIECKTCHEYDDKIIPIGPAARHLAAIDPGATSSMFTTLMSTNKLSNITSYKEVPHLINYTDTTYSIDSRARSYLDINCAHCHQPHGSARNSALNLLYTNGNLTSLGVYKTPIAAGNGSGGLYYDVVPGHPKESILYYRMNSSAPGVAMPEVGRKLIHEEGLRLIEAWIRKMRDE